MTTKNKEGRTLANSSSLDVIGLKRRLPESALKVSKKLEVSGLNRKSSLPAISGLTDHIASLLMEDENKDLGEPL